MQQAATHPRSLKKLTLARNTLAHAIATCDAVRKRVQAEQDGYRELHDMQTVVAYYRTKLARALDNAREEGAVSLH